MIASPRLQIEQLFHDRQAAEREPRFAGVATLRFSDSDYLNHETWIRPAMAQLGDLQGRRILDYGCGHGMASVVLARRGAIVTSFDLSAGYIAEARRRAEANEVMVDFLQADAEQLPFADHSFDAIWGSAILHHLDLHRAGAELRRVLRPGGIAVFCEPWGGNPILEFARKHLPYPGKHRTPDERPLRRRDLCPLESHFSQIEVRGYQLIGMARRLWKRESPVGGWLDRLDERLIRRSRLLEKWCRYVVITLR